MTASGAGGWTAEALLARAEGAALRPFAANTRRAYAGDFRRWLAWCARNGGAPEEPTAARALAYLEGLEEEGLATKTIERAHASLTMLCSAPRALAFGDDRAHRRRWHAVRAAAAARGGRRAPPLLLTELQKVSRALLAEQVRGGHRGRLALRDRAMLLVGWSAALRGAELASVALAGPDAGPVRLELWQDGARLTVARSKADQTGAKPREVRLKPGSSVATCPIAAACAWRDAAPVRPGERMFPDYRAVNAAVRRRCTRALGKKGWTSHSMRAGFATSAADAGYSREEIAATTGHASLKVLDGYVRQAQASAASAHAMGL